MNKQAMGPATAEMLRRVAPGIHQEQGQPTAIHHKDSGDLANKPSKGADNKFSNKGDVDLLTKVAQFCKRAKENKAKVGTVMGEYKRKTLRSGSKTGPVVKDRNQAVAIALSEARKAGEAVSPQEKEAMEQLAMQGFFEGYMHKDLHTSKQ